MSAITQDQWLILNAMADDYENLEQIYRLICLEVSPEGYNPSDPNSFYWREAKDRVPLSDIVDNLLLLVKEGLLSVRMEDGRVPSDTKNDLSYLWRGWFKITPNDLSYLWRGWFKITPNGRKVLVSSEFQ